MSVWCSGYKRHICSLIICAYFITSFFWNFCFFSNASLLIILESFFKLFICRLPFFVAFYPWAKQHRTSFVYDGSIMTSCPEVLSGEINIKYVHPSLERKEENRGKVNSILAVGSVGFMAAIWRINKCAFTLFVLCREADGIIIFLSYTNKSFILLFKN